MKFEFEKMVPKMEWIVNEENKNLRKRSKILTFPISNKDKIYINKMINYIDTCYDGQDEQLGIKPGMAIAAPQVGLNKKIIYLHFDYNNEIYHLLLANPNVIMASSTKSYISCGEGCLSDLNDHEGIVLRSNNIAITAFDLFNNKEVNLSFEGVPAICIQHELDHLDGILYFDKIEKDQDKILKDKNYIKY